VNTTSLAFDEFAVVKRGSTLRTLEVIKVWMAELTTGSMVNNRSRVGSQSRANLAAG
jgi:hypothetical protein